MMCKSVFAFVQNHFDVDMSIDSTVQQCLETHSKDVIKSRAKFKCSMDIEKHKTCCKIAFAGSQLRS
jgi:hypothetical protein